MLYDLTIALVAGLILEAAKMTLDQYRRKWKRQWAGEVADFAFRKLDGKFDGSTLKDRLADLMEWMDQAIAGMAEDSKNIEWPQTPAANGQPAKKGTA